MPVTFNEIKAETMKDPQLNKIVSYIKFGWPERSQDERDRAFSPKKDNMFLEHGCLVWGYRMVIPTSLRATVLRELHSGHLCVVKMKQVSRNYLWWEGLDADIEKICRKCSACSSQRDQPPPAPLHAFSPTEPWTRLNVDFLGPYKNKHYLVILDANTKWLEVERVPTTSAVAVITVFRKIFSRFGLPKSVVSDNGPPFTSQQYLLYLKKNGIKRVLVAPFHPSSNGAAENAVRSVKQVLKKATVENEDYDTALCKFLFTYRNAEHCTTQKEPAVALLGRRLRGRLDLLRPSTGELVREKQRVQEERRGGAPRDVAPGDAVLVRTYGDKDVKWKDGVVVGQTGPVSFVVQTDNNKIIKKHVDQLLHKNPRKSRHSLACVDQPLLDDENVDASMTDSQLAPLALSPSSASGHASSADDVDNQVVCGDEPSVRSPARPAVTSPVTPAAPGRIVARQRRDYPDIPPWIMTLGPRRKK